MAYSSSLTDDFALELVESFNVGPLEVVQDTDSLEQDVAFLFKLAGFGSWICLLQLDSPLTFVFVPVATYDFGIEVHVFSQVKALAHSV